MGDNGIVKETAHLHSDREKYAEGWERIFGKGKKEKKEEIEHEDDHVFTIFDKIQSELFSYFQSMANEKTTDDVVVSDIMTIVKANIEESEELNYEQGSPERKD